MLIPLLALVGLAVGSFLNVVAWRVPRGESVVRPVSACPACSTAIRSRDNVPVAGWLLLKGRCRDCDTAISPRYPVVEALTGVLFVVMGLRFGTDAALPAYLYLMAVGLALAVIDLDTHRLPDVLTLPSYPVAVVLLGGAALLGSDSGRPVRALLGGLAMWGFYATIRQLYPPGMGKGDVKLAGVLGLYTAWLGWGAWAVGVFAGFLFGGVWGVALIALGRAGRKTAVPFGPFMLAGVLLAVLVGQWLADAYLGLTVG